MWGVTHEPLLGPLGGAVDPLAVLLHLRVGGIPIGDTASGANIAGLPPNPCLAADGGRQMGGSGCRMGLAPLPM